MTGYLRFGEDGRRENFTLSVVEMTVNSDIVKVNRTVFILKTISTEGECNEFSITDRAMVGAESLPDGAGEIRSTARHSRV